MAQDKKHKGRTAQLNQSASSEQVVARQKPQESLSQASKITYHAVPRIPNLPGEAYISRHWRIQLINEEGDAKGFDVYDDVVLGRGTCVRERLGIDFLEWEAEEKGVSREHALLRPTPTCLYLVDIGSTNGTFHNIESVAPGDARELADGDMIVLGRLVFTIRIMHSPLDDLPIAILGHLPDIVKNTGPARSN
ncbi:MAG: FHA domain-containing protein [Anaerolineae bacterium]|nr:FHA domain-containing protein [Anaerolineae bacterium]